MIFDECTKWLSDLAVQGDLKAKMALSKLYGVEVVEAELARTRAEVSAGKVEYALLNQMAITLNDQIDDLQKRALVSEYTEASRQDLLTQNATLKKQLDQANAEVNIRVDLEDELQLAQAELNRRAGVCRQLEKQINSMMKEDHAANVQKAIQQDREEAAGLAQDMWDRGSYTTMDILERLWARCQKNPGNWGPRPHHLKPHERQMLTNSLRTAQQERMVLRIQNFKMKSYLIRLYKCTEYTCQMAHFFDQQELKNLDEALDIIA